MKQRKRFKKGKDAKLEQTKLDTKFAKALGKHLEKEAMRVHVEDEAIEEIKEAEKTLKEISRKYHRRLSYKWIGLIVGSLLSLVGGYYLIP